LQEESRNANVARSADIELGGIKINDEWFAGLGVGRGTKFFPLSPEIDVPVAGDAAMRTVRGDTVSENHRNDRIDFRY